MKQSGMEEILRDYTAGKLDARQANQELKKLGASLRLQPGRNEITEAEQQATVKETVFASVIRNYVRFGGVR